MNDNVNVEGSLTDSYTRPVNLFRGLQIVKRRSCVGKKQVDIEIEKLLRSSTNDNGDEVAQFQADPFIADQFYMAWLKPKLPREVVKAFPEAIALQGPERCFSPYKMDDNHNRQECSAIENAPHSVFVIQQSPSSNKFKIQPVDLLEVKTKELDSLLKESFQAYSLGQYALAATKYKSAWERMTDSTLKPHIKHINEDVLCYMLCLSLLETDQLNNLLEAVELLSALEKRSSHVFPAVYYALSKAHHKHYRFALALKAIEAGLAILESAVELREHKIPGSDITLEESTKDGLSVSLIAMKDECSKWHRPDAVCRMDECVPSSRWYSPNRDIYFSDPAFNGMVVLTCSNARNPCVMRFHQACWKSKKDQLSTLGKMSDKDIIGHECFTPNCESGEGTHSIITRVEVYGDDGKLKTQIEPPANPVVWAKRRSLPKGAIPKQLVKSRRPYEKTRRPVVAALPRPSSKGVTSENRDEKEWRLAKLAELRRNNFGIKPDCEWRPDVEMYGNPQMMKLGDYLGSHIFENDSPQLAAVNTFLFSYFYEFIKENGSVKREQILQKWNDDKILFDDTSDVLKGDIDICEFLLQSYKLVSLGDRIGVAENLPELYALVRKEICHCVRFALTDPLQAQAAAGQDDNSNTIASDCVQKKNESTFSALDSDAKIDSPEIETLPDPDALSEVISTNSEEATTVDDISFFVELKSSNDSVNLKEPLALSVSPDYKFGTDNSKKLDEIYDSNLNDVEHSENDSELEFLIDQEEEEEAGDEDLSEMGVDSKEIILPTVSDVLKEYELTHDLQETISKEESQAYGSDIGNHNPENNLAETNQDTNNEQIEPEFAVIAHDLKLTNNEDSDPTQSNEEEASPNDTLTVDEKFPKDSVEEKQDCAVSMGIKIAEITEKTAALSDAQSQDIQAEFDVQRIEDDLAMMVKTVAQLKSALEQNQVRSENHAQKLQQELISYEMLSQERMSELIKDLGRLDFRCTQLESEKSEIMRKFKECEIDQQRVNDENVLLRLENTEWMHKFDKLTEEKTEVENNLSLLLKEKTVIENNLDVLQRERDKMDKKLQKYHARFKEKICIESEQMSSVQKEKNQQQILDEKRLTERKAKLQSLSQEFSINKYALEKALEKCYDRVTMLNEVTNLIAIITGQHFIMAEAQAAWRDTDFYLRRTIGQYKDDYLKLKELLESDKEIENLNDVKLRVLNIVFPQTPNLAELYYKEKSNFIPQMPGLPGPWASQGAHFPDPRYFAPQAQRGFHPGPNLEQRSNDARNLAAESAFPINHRPRGPNDEIKGSGLQREGIPEAQKFDSKILSDDSSLYCDTENDDERASQARSSANNLNQVGRDLLIEKLKKKFLGVPQYDLMESVQMVRKKHNNTLSGMRIQDIMQECEPFITDLQGKHLAFYLPPKQMLPPHRIPPHTNRPNQRKVPPLIATGQQKNLRGPPQGQVDKLANNPSKARTASPAVNKKPAWGSVTSGIVNWNKNQEDPECTICLEGMNLHPVYMLPCHHSFHKKCIKGWLVENSICPICRIHCTMDDEFPPLPS